LTTLTLVVLLSVLGAVPVWAGTIQVDVNDAGCEGASGQPDPYSVVYCDIQDAIDDATAGDTINVAAGVYNENPITIDESLTINGAQANVEPVDGGRPSGESIVNGTVNIYADNVTVNGFEIPDRHDAIMGRNNRALHQNVQMLYNYIHSNDGGAVGINLICDNPTVPVTTFKNYVISHNYINLSVSTSAAIGLGAAGPDESKEYIYDGLEISYNEITTPKCMAAWTAHDPSKTTFSVNNPVIEHNSIHDCDRGLVLDNLVNADINNNEFMNCDHSSGTIIVLGGSVTDNYFLQQESSHGPSYLLTFLGTVLGAPTGSHDVTVAGNEFHYNNAYTTNLTGGARVHTGCDAGSITFSHNNFYDGGAGAGALALKNYVAGTDLDAELNWWSDASGAYHPTLNPDGLGGEVSDDIDFEPWLLQEWPSTDTDETKTKEVDGSGTVNDADTAEGIGDIEIDATAGITHTVTTAKYESNPGGDHTFVAEGYFDVHLDNIDNVASVTVDFCPATEDTVIHYWNGTDWLACSNQVFNPGTGCLVVTITADTQPDLDYLTGGPFASGHTPEPVGGIVVPVNRLGLVAPWMGLVGLAGLAALGVVVLRRRKL
jgi:hypothetical protein